MHLVVDDMNQSSFGEQAKVAIADLRRQLRQERLAMLAQLGIAEHDQVWLQVLGQEPMTTSKCDQPASQVQFLNRAAAPVDDLRGQHTTNAQLLAEAEQHDVDAGRINIG